MELGAESITLMNGNNVIWTMLGPFSEELAKGLYVGALHSIGLVDIENPEKNNKHYDNPWAIYEFQIHPQINGRNIRPRDSFINFGSNYDLELENTLGRLNNHRNHKRFAIWLENFNYGGNDDTQYSCWNFDTPEFIQGLLTMFRAFNINYSDVIVAAPVDNTGSWDIVGYPLRYLEDYVIEEEEDEEDEGNRYGEFAPRNLGLYGNFYDDDYD